MEEYKVGNKKPPLHTRFPVNRPHAPHTKKGPYLMPLLKKFLNKEINFEDPETQKMIRGRVKDAVIWRLILNATQGDNQAIKEILERIDGKMAQKVLGEGFKDTKIIIIRDKEKSESPTKVLPR